MPKSVLVLLSSQVHYNNGTKNARVEKLSFLSLLYSSISVSFILFLYCFCKTTIAHLYRRSVLHSNGIHNDTNFQNHKEISCFTREALLYHAQSGSHRHYRHYKTSKKPLESFTGDLQQAIRPAASRHDHSRMLRAA